MLNNKDRGRNMVMKKMYGKTWTCKRTSSKHVTCKPKAKAVKKSKAKTYRTKAGGKYHKTTRGLAQDQRLKSQEPHEKAYRKAKRKGKR